MSVQCFINSNKSIKTCLFELDNKQNSTPGRLKGWPLELIAKMLLEVIKAVTSEDPSGLCGRLKSPVALVDETQLFIGHSS